MTDRVTVITHAADWLPRVLQIRSTPNQQDSINICVIVRIVDSFISCGRVKGWHNDISISWMCLPVKLRQGKITVIGKVGVFQLKTIGWITEAPSVVI